MASAINPNNPLAGYMRQPKIYVRFPSDGKFWAKGSLKDTETGEHAVYSMTAKDELMFKTPDALLNGQSIVDVVQSCIPDITNAWEIPTLDLDTILIAIRLATYGEYMDVTHKIPKIEEEVTYQVDLKVMLDMQAQNQWIEEVPISQDLTVLVRPLTYKHVTKTNNKSFEASKILNIVNDESIPEDQKLEMFRNSFNNLASLTVDLIGESVYKIIAGDREVVERPYITEFINNADNEVIERINNHLKSLKTLNEVKPLQFTTTEEQQAAGAPPSYKIPLNFNNSDFFATGF